MLRRLIPLVVGLCLTGVSVWAGFPTVEGTATSKNDSSSTTHTVSLPTGITSGETLLVFIGDPAGNQAQSWSASGWTLIGQSWRGQTVGMRVFYKKATGSEGSTVDFSSGSDSTLSTHTAYRISGAEDPDTQAPEIGSFTSANNNLCNPQSVTPTGGAKDYLFVPAVSNENGGTTVSNCPTDYTSLIQANGSASNTTTGSCERQLNASSEDPARFDLSATENVICVALAVHPGAAPETPSKMMLLGVGP